MPPLAQAPDQRKPAAQEDPNDEKADRHEKRLDRHRPHP